MDRIQKTTTRSTAPATEDAATVPSNPATDTVDKTEYDAIVCASHNPRYRGRNRAESSCQQRLALQDNLQLHHNQGQTDQGQETEQRIDQFKKKDKKQTTLPITDWLFCFVFNSS